MNTIARSALLLAVMACGNVAMAQGYRLLHTFHIASPGGWDYVALSPANDNIYISHATQVNILNRNTGDSVGIIPNTSGVHGIAFAPAFNKGFTSNGKSNTVTVFDISTNAITAQVKTGDKPDAIMFDPFSKQVYVCNAHSKDLTVIDPATNEVIKTIPLGGKPETAVSGEDGLLYINIEDRNEIVVLDTRTMALTRRWKTGKGDEPSGLAIDTRTKRLFAGCGNKLLVVLSADNGKVIKEMPIGDGCDGVVFDTTDKTIFCANADGTLTIFKETAANSYTLLQNM